MLSGLQALLIGAAAATHPIDGAFGALFGMPLAAEQRGASLSPEPWPAAPDNLEMDAAEIPPGDHPGWYYLKPTPVPEVLRAARFLVLLTRDGHPARIRAELEQADCDADFAWLERSLTRKYGVEEDVAVAPRAPHASAMRIRWEDRQVDLACGRGLAIEYSDTTALGRWRAEHQLALQAFEALETQRQELERRIIRAEDRQFADTFTYGERFRLDGGLTVTFGTPWPTEHPHVPDVPFDITLSGLPAPFDRGRYHLTLDPEALPIKLSGEIPDADGRLFERLSAAVRAKYGSPMKDGARHKIFRINGNYLILRALPRLGEAQLVYIDAKAQRAQEARARAAELAAIAAEEAEFRKKTEGL